MEPHKKDGHDRGACKGEIHHEVAGMKLIIELDSEQLKRLTEMIILQYETLDKRLKKLERKLKE